MRYMTCELCPFDSKCLLASRLACWIRARFLCVVSSHAASIDWILRPFVSGMSRPAAAPITAISYHPRVR